MTQHEAEGMWEQIFSRDNLMTALKRVQSNGGAPGVDGMRVDELPDHLRAHWPSIPREVGGWEVRAEFCEAGRDTEAGEGEEAVGDTDTSFTLHLHTMGFGIRY